MEEANEETGWKLVHGDVLRPPTTYPMLFAVRFSMTKSRNCPFLTLLVVQCT